VLGIEQPGELATFVARGVADDEAADKAVAAVDAEVVLVTKSRSHELGSHGGRPPLARSERSSAAYSFMAY
jgi:hypothetical protein